MQVLRCGDSRFLCLDPYLGIIQEVFGWRADNILPSGMDYVSLGIDICPSVTQLQYQLHLDTER